MKYEVILSNSCKKSVKKLNDSDKYAFFTLVEKIANDEILEPKYRDHSLKGKYLGYKDCHIKPDLVLIYRKDKEKLMLYCLNVGSHSELNF